MDCGPTCLKMVIKFHGKHPTMETLRKLSGYDGKSDKGVSLLGISRAAQKLGFKAIGVRVTFKELLEKVPLPCILCWIGYHFVVLTPESNKKNLTIADPAEGMITLSKKQFCDCWINEEDNPKKLGIALLLVPPNK